ncbi:MAG: N(G),N(G)-dimethylarginine dimethylaminohydrolase [Candidatus Heimdallarchaeota archaeon LC_3]|nr:MAG: N(G),N(G)-dimethylarginine dimethylaminohydrolase [Candidatus Heimdallarchaeota archaeon LC_3]
MIKVALVREPSKDFLKCISNHPLKHQINIEKTQKQHKAYCSTLEELGLELIYITEISDHPDSCFVEDTAIIHYKKALICRMGAESRRGEEISVEEILKQYLPVSKIKKPGTIEGGDIIHFSTNLISGFTQRTNLEGIEQLESFFEIPVKVVEDIEIIHLKSYVTALRDDLIITSNRYLDHPVLTDYKKISTQENEEYAANTLTVNGTVIIPEGFTRINNIITDYGFDVVSLDVSEFQKCEGALTCLSLIF